MVWEIHEKKKTYFHEATDLKMEQFNSFTATIKKNSTFYPTKRLYYKTKLLIPLSTGYSTAICCNTHRPNVESIIIFTRIEPSVFTFLPNVDQKKPLFLIIPMYRQYQLESPFLKMILICTCCLKSCIFFVQCILFMPSSICKDIEEALICGVLPRISLSLK